MTSGKNGLDYIWFQDHICGWHSDKIHEADKAGADDPAEFVMTTCEDFDEAVEDAGAAAAYGRTKDEESLPIEFGSTACCPARARSGSGASTVG